MIGKAIFHYKILEKLGEGGMGEVYLAEDTKLDRKVALKFLPRHIMADSRIKARFMREAKAAAALNHPNIVTVYEVGEYKGQSFISMEYVDGHSLKDLISKEKLATAKVIDLAKQICEGLTKAHKVGIVHRDIKPENILINREGLAKIADFGLAKVKGVSRLTKEDSTLGTLNYMSPEQVNGEDVDHRSDIFSFGVVLYEMITGQLPFKGENDAAVFYSILNKEPEPLERLKAVVSEQLRITVDKALKKEPEESIDALLADLKLGKTESIKTIATGFKAKRSKIRFAIFALLLIGLFLISPRLFNKRKSKQFMPVHKQLTFTGNAGNPTISPNGEFIAYVDGKPQDEKVVLVQDLAGGKPVSIFFASSIGPQRWAPNGSELVITATMTDSPPGTFLVPRLGGASRRILNLVGLVLSSSPDGSRITATGNSLRKIGIFNIKKNVWTFVLLKGDYEWILDAEWSPLSNRLLCLTDGRNRKIIWTIKIDGTQQVKVLVDSLAIYSPRWSANGQAIYFFRENGQAKDLLKIKVAVETGKAKGAPEILQAGLSAGASISISGDNKRLVYTRELSYSNLWRTDLDANRGVPTVKTEKLTTGTSMKHMAQISPDGKHIAFSMGNTVKANIFIMPIEGGEMQQSTFFNSFNICPVWSPDGDEIAFSSTEGGRQRVWTIKSNRGTPRPYDNSQLGSIPSYLTWSPGSDILYQRPGNRNFHFLNPKTEEERPLVANEGVGWIFVPRYSPDGKRVIVFWNRQKSGENMAGLWLISLQDSSQVLLRRGSLIYPIAWSADGELIYAMNLEGIDADPLHMFKFPNEIVTIQISDGKLQKFITLPSNNGLIVDISMTPNGQRFITEVKKEQSDIWMIENFDPENELETPLDVLDSPEIRLLTYLENGTLLFQKGNYTESEASFLKGLELAPSHPAILTGLGKIELLRKNYAAAEKHFRTALAIDSNEASINHYLGYLFTEQKDFSEARKFAQEALAVDSRFRSYNLMGWILIAGELDIERGIEFAQKALDSMPDYYTKTAKVYPFRPLPEHSLGLAYLKRGQYKRAVEYLEQAAEQLPDRQAIIDDLQLAKRKLKELTVK